MVTQVREWVLLAYRVPREPSRPRISIWRKLRQLGVGHLVDGLVALPLDARNRERLEWIADEVLEAGGHASVWIAEPTTASQEKELTAEMRETVGAEYRAVVEAAGNVAPDEPQRRRTLARLRREVQRIQSRDYFAAPEADAARAALEKLATDIEEVRR